VSFTLASEDIPEGDEIFSCPWFKSTKRLTGKHHLKKRQVNFEQPFFYKKLHEVLSPVKDVKFCHIQQLRDREQLTVYYDEGAEDYSKIEDEVFAVHRVIRKAFPEKKLDLLVLLYLEPFHRPDNVDVIIER
jgi:hypothetical protein